MFIFKTDLEKKIADLIGDVMLEDGYDLVRIRSASGPITGVIQIMFDRLDGEKVGISDCEKVTRSISKIIEIEGILNNKYSLEVSSPGIDRPLTRLADFEHSIGKLIKLTTIFPINGRRKFSGRLTSIENQILKLTLENNELALIKQDNILESNLIFEWPQAKSSNQKYKK